MAVDATQSIDSHQHSLSYLAYSPFIGDALATGGIYVSADAPDEVLPLIQDAIGHCRDDWVDQTTVDKVVEFYITRYLMATETNEAQAASLARAQIYQGDYRLAVTRSTCCGRSAVLICCVSHAGTCTTCSSPTWGTPIGSPVHT